MGKSVADGKSAIASAITSKGVNTASDAAYATMAANIKSIKTTPTLKTASHTFSFGGTGTASYTFNGFTFLGITNISFSRDDGRKWKRTANVSGTTVTVTISGDEHIDSQEITVTVMGY